DNKLGSAIARGQTGDDNRSGARWGDGGRRADHPPDGSPRTGSDSVPRAGPRGDEGSMSSMRGVVRVALALAVLGGSRGRAGEGESTAGGEVFVARLVRPDRQAAEMLRLFQGARWSDPAAALAAWKQGTRDAVSLGKPAEAVIALFNPEMIAEWRALDGAELRIGLEHATGELGWLAILPRDDGTVAAGITAMRL